MNEANNINNFIPISRKIFNHPFWFEIRKYSKFEAWMDMIQMARYKDSGQLIGNSIVNIKRGQFSASLRYLSARWGWSTKKVNYFFKCLMNEKMIIKEVPQHTRKTLITICNYEMYNYSTWQEEQMRSLFSPPLLDEVMDYCHKRKSNVDPERFFSFYTSKDWMVGKHKMKNWKAAINSWERTEHRKNTTMTHQNYDGDCRF